ALLSASRAAFREGDLDSAEQLADAAQKRASSFTFSLWGDSPAKVKKDIQAARAHKNAPVAEVKPAPENTQEAKEQAKPKESSGGMFAPVKNLFSRKKSEPKDKE